MRELTPALSLLLTLAACGVGDDGDAEACITERFAMQPQTRFVQGETYYLPRLDDSASCQARAWQVVAAPEDNGDVLVAGADGLTRFTPTTTGEFGFGLGGDEVLASITVVPSAGRPFHNLNYYASSSVALVGDELWVADVYSPTVTRLDPASLAVRGRIEVGPWPVAVAWRPGMATALVVQRAGDTLGVIDVESKRLVDAVWVGDEPSNVVVSADGKTAYVALATEAAVAVVDVERAAVTTRIASVQDPLALALAPDGKRLYVASHRSGQPSRFPFEADPVAAEFDLDIIDTASNEVVKRVLDIGATITGLLVSPDGARLYVAMVRNDTEISQLELSAFQNTIVVLDASTGEELAAADLDVQDTSAGAAAAPHHMALAGDRLWVAVESSDLALALDADTLDEVERVPAPGRPRGVVVDGERVYMHGAQGFVVTQVAGGAPTTVSTGEDPRPALVADGQRFFTGAGDKWAADRSCNSCHADGVGDTLVWQAGPFADARYATRSIFWLEGTPELGWDAYVTTIGNFAFGVTSNVARRLDTAQQQGLEAYLASIMPPPPANGLTARDGTMSAQAERGAALFAGAANCVSCHPLPLSTNRTLLAEGITPGAADVPALVGAYRHGVWLKHGESTTLRDAVVKAAAYTKVQLSADETDDLTRYLAELTARDFILLASAPEVDDVAAPVDQPVRLTFSEPVWDDPTNLAKIHLRGADGKDVAAEVTVEGRHVELAATLTANTKYSVVIDAELESLRERPLYAASTHTFTTAEAPTLKLDGVYTWTVQFPAIDIAGQGFDFEALLPTVATVTAKPTASGASLAIDYGQGFVLAAQVVIAGNTLYWPSVPIAVGGSGVDGHVAQFKLVDVDADGVADEAVGEVQFSGPGMDDTLVAWDLRRPVDPATCEVGASGDVVVEVADLGGTPTITWGDATALSLFVTDPQAVLPAGPGQPVSGGDTQWSLQLEEFPNGFLGPVTYGMVPMGAVDTTEVSGGAGPGAAALEPGGCYKFSVITTDFKSGQSTVRLP